MAVIFIRSSLLAPAKGSQETRSICMVPSWSPWLNLFCRYAESRFFVEFLCKPIRDASLHFSDKIHDALGKEFAPTRNFMVDPERPGEPWSWDNFFSLLVEAYFKVSSNIGNTIYLLNFPSVVRIGLSWFIMNTEK